MTIREGFINFAQKYRLPLNERDENGNSIFSFYISGEKGKYNAYAMCMEEERMIVFFVDCNIRVESQHRALICEYLMSINYQLKGGSFQIDPDTGDITVRICQYVFGDDNEQSLLIERVILFAGMIADNYCHDIVKRLP